MLDPESTAIQIVTNAMGSFTFDTRGLSSSAEANLQDITGMWAGVGKNLLLPVSGCRVRHSLCSNI